MKKFLLRFIIIGNFSFLFFLSCSDKNHTVINPDYEGNFEFQTLTVDNIVSGRSYITSPKLGNHEYLYSGSKNNYNCEFTLIDLTSYYALNAYPDIIASPDTVDSMMFKMYLSEESLIQIPEILLTYLHSENDSIFHEDETLFLDDNGNEFDPNGFPEKIPLGAFQLSQEDTNSAMNSIEIIIKDTANIRNFMFYLDDTSKCLLLSQTETSDFIKIYSSESNYQPEFYIYYTVTDSTDSSYVSSFSLPVLQDVTLINPPEFLILPQDSLYIGGSIFQSILEFSLEPFSVLPDQFLIKEDSYLYLETPFDEAVSINILAYTLSDSIDSSEHFITVEEGYSVDRSIYMPTWFEDGKLKIGIQSYLQYALTQEIEHFGINLQGSINNDPFSILSLVKPDSSYSTISIEYVSNQ